MATGLGRLAAGVGVVRGADGAGVVRNAGGGVVETRGAGATMGGTGIALGVAVGSGVGRSTIGIGVAIGPGRDGMVIAGWSLEMVPRTGTLRMLGTVRGGGVGRTVMLRMDWLRFTRAPVLQRLVRAGILSAFP